MSDSTFRSRLILGFALSLMVILLITIISYLNLNKLKSEHQSINHSQQVTGAATNLLQVVTDAETAARGYFGTGEALFIKPFNQALLQIDTHYQKLLTITQSNPAQYKRAEELGTYISQKKSIMQSYVAQREASGATGNLPPDRVLKGKTEMDNIRRLVSAIAGQEQRMFISSQRVSDQAAKNTAAALFTGALVFIVIISLLFFYIRRTFGQKQNAEQRVLQSNHALEKTLAANQHQNWMLAGLKHLAEEMQGQKNVADLGAIILKELLTYTNGTSGTLYVYNKKSGLLNLCASYAVAPLDKIRKQFALNETWIGQAASLEEVKMVSGKINPHLSLSTSVVQKELVHCFLVPFFYEREVLGILELGYQEMPDENKSEFVLSTINRIGVTVHNMLSRSEVESLYHEMQQQAEELQVQQEELREMNEELLLKAERSRSGNSGL